ncbi:colicin D domain-containing protein [Chloroflexus sp.]|uniref:colicin D domain-containing protein n=1 Tax=Chloroflexus sp. TaxID=1904827 RepID=UPI00257A8FDD|nr:colicin D domain-containing protein [Chloroflexus sp.]
MWRSAGSGPVNPQDLNRYAYALNNPLKYTDPTGHLPLLPVLIAGGLALLKAIDDGWTAWDAFQATRTLADPEAPAEEKRAATANLALTAALEAAEPDDMLPVGLPRDDLLRIGIIGGSKGAGKSLPAATESLTRRIAFTPSQIQKKFKHATDFGITGNWNKTNAARFQQALEDHVYAPTTQVIRGTYHGQDVIHYYDPATGLNVMTDHNGTFLSGWKLSPEQIQHLTTTGSLGGG